MEYWVSKTDDSLIVNSDSCRLYKVRSLSAKPSISVLRRRIFDISVFHHSMTYVFQLFTQGAGRNSLLVCSVSFS